MFLDLQLIVHHLLCFHLPNSLDDDEDNSEDDSMQFCIGISIRYMPLKFLPLSKIYASRIVNWEEGSDIIFVLDYANVMLMLLPCHGQITYSYSWHFQWLLCTEKNELVCPKLLMDCMGFRRKFGLSLRPWCSVCLKH